MPSNSRSIKVVAERAGIAQTYVSDIELGFKLPNLLTVVRLVIALECKVGELTSAFDKTDSSSLTQRQVSSQRASTWELPLLPLSIFMVVI